MLDVDEQAAVQLADIQSYKERIQQVEAERDELRKQLHDYREAAKKLAASLASVRDNLKSAVVNVDWVAGPLTELLK